MSIGDLVSRLTPTFGAEAGVVMFAAVFAVLTVRLWSGRQRAALEAARTLPLDDDDLRDGDVR